MNTPGMELFLRGLLCNVLVCLATWCAYKLKEETAEKEGFDKINFTGSFYTDEEYPGCPYCGAKKCFVCGNCGKVSCYDGSDKVVCNWCGSNGTAADDDGKLDVSGGGF